jgi:hypothetical protein
MLALIRARVGQVPWPGFRRLIDYAADFVGIDDNDQLELYWRVHDHLQRWRRSSDAGLGGRLSYVPQTLNRLRAKRRAAAATSPPRSTTLADRVMNVHRRAARAYLPGPFGGRVTVLWPADEVAILRGDDSAGWRRFAPNVMSHVIPGGHSTCVTTHLDALAARLRAAINEAAER